MDGHSDKLTFKERFAGQRGARHASVGGGVFQVKVAGTAKAGWHVSYWKDGKLAPDSWYV